MIPFGGFAGIIAALALAFIAFIRVFLWRQITDLRRDVQIVSDKLAALEKLYAEQRGLKHKVTNDLVRCVMALDLVRRLSRDCNCGALNPVQEIIDRLFLELETLVHNATQARSAEQHGQT